jgi:hypothetical protein
VWCRFPENKGIQPGPKPRPALVITVFDDEAPHFVVEVVYGTSQKTDTLRSGEFLIARSDRDAFSLAGLSYPTKFNLKNRVELPFDHEWFAVPPTAPFGQIPKLGTLHPALITRLKSAWGALKFVSGGLPY